MTYNEVQDDLAKIIADAALFQRKAEDLYFDFEMPHLVSREEHFEMLLNIKSLDSRATLLSMLCDKIFNQFPKFRELSTEDDGA